MIRASVLYNLSDFDDISEMIAEFPDLYFAVLRDALYPTVVQPMLAELRKYPPPAKRPWQFATEKSRRFYFAVIYPAQRGPYKRTGKLGQSWRVDVTMFGGDLLLTAENTATSRQYLSSTSRAKKPGYRGYGRYVMGDRQVPGHRNTGWRLADDIYNFYKPEALEVARVSLYQAVRSA